MSAAGPQIDEDANAVSPAELINHLGTEVVAKACNVSVQTARRWRKRLPDDRITSLARLAGKHGLSINSERQTTSMSMTVSREAMLLDTHAPSATEQDDEPITVAIAARKAEFAKAQVEACSFQADGLPPTEPVPGYYWRLVGLALLDLPPITLAFFTVAQVSPIIALVSALALAVFLILGAHAIGAPLRYLANGFPHWLPRLVSFIVLAAFLAATVFGILDLRAKGLKADVPRNLGVSVFSDQLADPTPAPFMQAMLFTAGLVTIGSLIFAIAWSYAHHSPQADFVRAERRYQKSLRHLEQARHKARRTALAVSTFLVLLLSDTQQQAAACGGRDVLALLDATTAYDEQDRRLIMPAIDAMAASLKPGDRLRVRSVGESVGASRVLFDACMPESASALAWLITNPATKAKERQALFTDLRRAIEGPIHRHNELNGTALADTLAAFAPADAIWLFSDLLETQTTSVDELLKGQLAGPLLPAMPGVTVNVAGIGRFHDTQRRDLTGQEFGGLINAWSRYLETAGVSLRLPDIER